MDNRDIDNLIIDYLLYEDNSAPVDPKLEQWIVQSEANSLTFARYKTIWERLPHAARRYRFDTVRAFEEVDKANRKRVSLQGRIKNWGYALSGVAVTLLLFLLTNQFVMVDEKPFSMTTDYGSRSEVVLPDGSNVKLNAGSRITYQHKKKENIREVIFEGEGFFEVSKNDDLFVVKTTGGIEVEVLGTTFNLTAYADEPDIQVSLIEGKVQFHTNNRKLVMKPGQIAIAHKSTNEIRLQEGVLSHSYGWLNKRLYLDNLSLSETCKILERWYDVKISLKEGIGNEIHYTGVLQEENITGILDALCRLSEINYQISGKKIDISPK